MGLLIDSTVFITAERRRQTPQGVVATLLDDYGDVELALSAGNPRHFDQIPELVVHRYA